MGKITKERLFTGKTKFINETGLANSSAQLIDANSIIYSSRAPIGHINIVPFQYTTNQGCKSLTPILVDVNYLYFILDGSKKYIEKLGSGTTFKELSLTGFSNITLPLPPLSEQQRIVSKIEELFTELDKIDEAQEKYDSAANLLTLTYHLSSVDSYQFNEMKISDIITTITIPKTKKVTSTEIQNNGTYPVVTQAKQFIKGYINEDGKTMTFDKPVILFGDHTKEVKLIDFTASFSGDGIKLITPKLDDIDIEFLFYSIKFNLLLLGDRGYRRYFPLLKNLSIPIPPLDIQKQIVKK